MHYARSEDGSKTWGPVKSFGFKGHCPYFLQHRSGVILLAHRVPATSLHWTNDDGKTWQGPVLLDSVGGAYPSMVELPTGEVTVSTTKKARVQVFEVGDCTWTRRV